jgi:predicted HAD superfamily Cof-like phosphohydrolase
MSLKNMIEKVYAFQEAMGIEQPNVPTVPTEHNGLVSTDLYKAFTKHANNLKNIAQQAHNDAAAHNKNEVLLRIELLTGEVAELSQALADGSELDALDALCDIMYVLLGTITKLGMQSIFYDAFNEVHRSNLSKLVNGKGIKDSAGRMTKGPQYSPPELMQFLSMAHLCNEVEETLLKDD